MRKIVLAFLCFNISLAPAAVVLDRIAAIVGTQAIKISDISRDLRLTAFLNQQPIPVSADEKRKAAERLVDQTIIRTELATGGYTRATDADADAFLLQLQKQRFGGSESRLAAGLQQYSITPAQLHAQLLWQLSVLRFIDQRFRPGILVTDEEVRAYFDQHQAELQRGNAKSITFDAMAPKIRESLEGERIDKEFNAWLEGARKRTRVEFRNEAFQ